MRIRKIILRCFKCLIGIFRVFSIRVAKKVLIQTRDESFATVLVRGLKIFTCAVPADTSASLARNISGLL